VGGKQERVTHRKQLYSLPSNADPLFNRALSLSCNQRKLDKGILEIAARFVPAITVSCCQVTSPAVR
jgi:hypothetical protein